MTAAASPKPPARQARRFVLVTVILAVIYGVWAATLSFCIVVHQQAVRQHLWLALRERPRGAFPDTRTALHAASKWVSLLNAVYPTEPCQPGPAFRLVHTRHDATWAPAQACTVIIAVRHRHIVVHAYDTQGRRMDNVFERLYPPPRRL